MTAALGCALLLAALSQPAADAPAPLRFLALGDSYTIGEGVAPAGHWPAQLAALLRGRGLPVQEPVIIAKTGWTTDELTAGIDAAAPAGTFDLVTLLIGVNNQYRGRSADEYRKQFRALLTRAVGFAGGRPGRVVVLSIPDWGVTPFAKGRDRTKIAMEIDRFNAVNREETERAGTRYVNITTDSRWMATDASLVVADGLHPSGAMYSTWADLSLSVALAALGRGDDDPGPRPATAAGAAEREALLRVDREFSALSVARGAAEAFFTYMTDDAVQLPMGDRPVIGRTEIRRRLAEGGTFTLTWEPHAADVSRSGDLGYTWGTYELHGAGPDGQPRASYGKYVTIWKKQPDGAWRAVLDTGNPGPPPDAP
jgi:ketosteroid isomerase-like protein/lysophospholipase L1-like esterase